MSCLEWCDCTDECVGQLARNPHEPERNRMTTKPPAEIVNATALTLANEYHASLDLDSARGLSELCDAGYWRQQARAKLTDPAIYVPPTPNTSGNDLHAEWRERHFLEGQREYLARQP